LKPSDIPLIGGILGPGPEDPMFGLLMLIGPVSIVLAAVAGRTPITTGLTAAYVLFFFSYVLYRGLR